MSFAPVAAEVLAGSLLRLPGSPQLLVVSFAPVAAEVLAGSLLGLVGSAQLFVVSFAPVAAEVFTGDLLGLLLLGQGGALGVLEAGHGAGGLFE